MEKLQYGIRRGNKKKSREATDADSEWYMSTDGDVYCQHVDKFGFCCTSLVDPNSATKCKLHMNSKSVIPPFSLEVPHDDEELLSMKESDSLRLIPRDKSPGGANFVPVSPPSRRAAAVAEGVGSRYYPSLGQGALGLWSLPEQKSPAQMAESEERMRQALASAANNIAAAAAVRPSPPAPATATTTTSPSQQPPPSGLVVNPAESGEEAEYTEINVDELTRRRTLAILQIFTEEFSKTEFGKYVNSIEGDPHWLEHALVNEQPRSPFEHFIGFYVMYGILKLITEKSGASDVVRILIDKEHVPDEKIGEEICKIMFKIVPDDHFYTYMLFKYANDNRPNSTVTMLSYFVEQVFAEVGSPAIYTLLIPADDVRKNGSRTRPYLPIHARDVFSLVNYLKLNVSNPDVIQAMKTTIIPATSDSENSDVILDTTIQYLETKQDDPSFADLNNIGTFIQLCRGIHPYVVDEKTHMMWSTWIRLLLLGYMIANDNQDPPDDSWTSTFMSTCLTPVDKLDPASDIEEIKRLRADPNEAHMALAIAYTQIYHIYYNDFKSSPYYQKVEDAVAKIKDGYPGIVGVVQFTPEVFDWLVHSLYAEE